MASPHRTPRPGRRRQPPLAARLSVESLEARNLLAAFTAPPEPLPDDTLDQAHDLGPLTAGAAVQAADAVGNSPAGAADVDWYRFTLDAPARVTLSASAQPAGNVLLSLFNDDPYDFNPPFGTTSGHRLVEQSTVASPAGDVFVRRDLPAGTWFVAVSGAGNAVFHPALADSGSFGAEGDYQLEVRADPSSAATDGLGVLSAEPGPGAVLDRSPLVLRVSLAQPLFPESVPFDVIDNLPLAAHLTWSPSGAFGDGNDQDVPLAFFSWSAPAGELRLAPAAPLCSGWYRFTLGDGVSAFAAPFQVSGVEGNTAAGAGADDTPDAAHPLGDLAGAGLVTVRGAIGDDPTDSLPFNPSDVDLYHFQVAGPGRFGFLADVFAGRIGSPLDPGVSLFRFDADLGLVLIASNDNTLNRTGDDVALFPPLYNDASLYVGLAAGDYYLAVSGSGNVPDPLADPVLEQMPGQSGIFDPTQSHSGWGGWTTGEYLLNVLLWSDDASPQVVATTPAAGDVLAAPPTAVEVHFSEPVNLQQLAYEASQYPERATPAVVFVLGPDNVEHAARLLEYYPAENRAEFLLLDALPDGAWELHLSGARGLTDYAGNPLAGNDPVSGDFVVPFTIQGSVHGSPGDPTRWVVDAPAGPLDPPLDLGPLFPNELQAGVTVERTFVAAGDGVAAGTDAYVVQLLENQTYLFNLTAADGSELPADLLPRLDGVALVSLGEHAGSAPLDAGTYVVLVDRWVPPGGGSAGYQLTISALRKDETPAPLTVGPAPTFRVRLAPPASPPEVTRLPEPGAPPPAPVPPTRLVVPPLPTADSGAVVPVAGPAQPSARTTGTPTAAAGVPANVLLALSAGPVGGVSGGSHSEPGPGDRVLTRGSELLTRDRVVRVAFLTRIDGAGNFGEDSEATVAFVGLRRMVGSYLGELGRWWQTFLDIVSQMGGKLDVVTPPVPDPEDVPPEMAPETLDDLDASAPPVAPAALPGADRTWAAAAVLAGALLPSRRRRRVGRRTARRRGRRSGIALEQPS